MLHPQHIHPAAHPLQPHSQRGWSKLIPLSTLLICFLFDPATLLDLHMPLHLYHGCLFFWMFYRPEQFSILGGLFLSLICDTTTGHEPGYFFTHWLSFCLGILLIRSYIERLSFMNTWYSMLAYISFFAFGLYTVDSLSGHNPFSIVSTLLSIIWVALTYPLLTKLLARFIKSPGSEL